MKIHRLIVNNLESSVTDRQLEELFSAYGNVSYVKMKRGGHSGIVGMSTRSQALLAMKALDGESLWGRSMNIRTVEP